MEAVELWQSSRPTLKPEILFTVAFFFTLWEPRFWAERCATQTSSAHYTASIHPFIYSQSEVCPVLWRRKTLVGLALVSAVTQLPKMTPKHTQQCPHQSEVISRQHSILQPTSTYSDSWMRRNLAWEHHQSFEKGLQQSHKSSTITQDKSLAYLPAFVNSTQRDGEPSKYITFSTLLWKKQKVTK